MNETLQNFIKENIYLIEENTKESWEQIYKKLGDNLEIKSEFTETLLDANIEPAKILGYVPKYYLYHSEIEKYKIPNNVTSIGVCAFKDCENLASIEIPNSVTSIGLEAFSDCSNLTSVTIGDGVTTISYEVFRGCHNLTNVVIGGNVTSIGYSAFAHCSSLTSVVIPNGVTNIGYYAFSGCINLTSVEIPASTTIIEDCIFVGCGNLKEIQYKGTKKQAIKCGIGDISKKEWRESSYIERIICLDGVIEL